MHTIRLRGPWQVEPLERYVLQPDGGYERSTSELPAAAQMTMPADWAAVLGPRFLGARALSRNFQKPTGLESGERVWLVVEAPRSRGIVRAKPQALGCVRFGGQPGGLILRNLLEDHNRLEIVVEHPAIDDSGNGSTTVTLCAWRIGW